MTSPRGVPSAQPGPGVDPSARYARQVVLPGWGASGQDRMAAARILVIGAGGLGSSALWYLAAAGVGTIGIVDSDVVDLSDLNRQILHSEAALGQPKVDSAQRALARFNSRLRVHPYRLDLDSGQAGTLFPDYHIVLDCCDNMPTRRVIGAAAARLGMPHVWGAVEGAAGQASVWWPPAGPCLSCVFPATDQPEDRAATVPVLGVAPGLIGTLQAAEAIKLITGLGQPLVGRVVVYDAMEQSWGSIPVYPDPDCPVCDQAGVAHPDRSASTTVPRG